MLFDRDLTGKHCTLITPFGVTDAVLMQLKVTVKPLSLSQLDCPADKQPSIGSISMQNHLFLGIFILGPTFGPERQQIFYLYIIILHTDH